MTIIKKLAYYFVVWLVATLGAALLDMAGFRPGSYLFIFAVVLAGILAEPKWKVNHDAL
jgi:hypothetical protein